MSRAFRFMRLPQEAGSVPVICRRHRCPGLWGVPRRRAGDMQAAEAARQAARLVDRWHSRLVRALQPAAAGCVLVLHAPGCLPARSCAGFPQGPGWGGDLHAPATCKAWRVDLHQGSAVVDAWLQLPPTAAPGSQQLRASSPPPHSPPVGHPILPVRLVLRMEKNTMDACASSCSGTAPAVSLLWSRFTCCNCGQSVPAAPGTVPATLVHCSCRCLRLDMAAQADGMLPFRPVLPPSQMAARPGEVLVAQLAGKGPCRGRGQGGGGRQRGRRAGTAGRGWRGAPRRPGRAWVRSGNAGLRCCHAGPAADPVMNVAPARCVCRRGGPSTPGTSQGPDLQAIVGQVDGRQLGQCRPARQGAPELVAVQLQQGQLGEAGCGRAGRARCARRWGGWGASRTHKAILRQQQPRVWCMAASVPTACCGHGWRGASCMPRTNA